MSRRQPYLAASTRVLLLVALAACGDQQDEAPSGPSRDEIQQMVIGNAAAGLDETGHFRLVTSSSPKEISQGQARALASAYITRAGFSFRRTLEKDRGGPVDLENLHACGPVLYAATAFEPLPAEVPRAYHHFFGSRWLVGFCGKQGGVEVSVSVSALATELTVVDGRVDYGNSDGTEFFSLGVPPQWDGPAGLSAERAVMLMAKRAGRRVSQVPTLMAPDPRIAYPQGAVWRIQLESPVKLHGKKSGRVREEKVVYAGLHEDVGFEPRAVGDDAKTLRIPTLEQPPDRPFQYSYFPPGSGKSPSDTWTTGTAPLHRRIDAPVTLEPATTTGGN